ncbi:MAG: hypothetical protein GQ570_01860 [Helicobacteraceae bacterium]|nr:hypothetical protein [Helicobacteraceae bacterium]
MEFSFIEYSDQQRKEFINSEHLYQLFSNKQLAYNKTYRYKMGWQKSKQKEYLYKTSLDTNKRVSLGSRNSKTEAIHDEFKSSKAKAQIFLKKTKESILKKEKINKIEQISRVPNVIIDIFKKINELKLDDKVVVIGTNSLYAYEAKSGVFIQEQHLATFDIDIMNKKNKKISFAFKEKIPGKTLKGILLDIDKTFKVSSEASYRFINDNDVVVELIAPLSPYNIHDKTDKFAGVIGLELKGIVWLENSRLMKQMVIGENGKFAYITTIHPLEFAVYKNWLSQQVDREPIKRARDQNQSSLVTLLIKEYLLNIDIQESLKNIKNFPKVIVDDYRKNILNSLI